MPPSHIPSPSADVNARLSHMRRLVCAEEKRREKAVGKATRLERLLQQSEFQIADLVSKSRLSAGRVENLSREIEALRGGENMEKKFTMVSAALEKAGKRVKEVEIECEGLREGLRKREGEMQYEKEEMKRDMDMREEDAARLVTEWQMRLAEVEERADVQIRALKNAVQEGKQAVEGLERQAEKDRMGREESDGLGRDRLFNLQGKVEDLKLQIIELNDLHQSKLNSVREEADATAVQLWADMTEMNGRAEQRLEGLRKEKCQADDCLRELQARLERDAQVANDKVRNLEEALASCEAGRERDIAEQQKELTNLSDQLATRNAQLDKAERRTEHVTRDVTKLKTALDASKDALAMAEIRALDIGNSGNEARLALEEKICKLESDLACANSVTDRVRTECETANARVGVLESTASDVRADAKEAVNRLKIDLETVNTSLSSSSARNKQLQEQLDAKVAEMTAEIENLSNANCKLESNVTDLQQQLKTADEAAVEKVERLEKALALCETQKETNHSEHHKELANVSDQLAACNTKLEKAEKHSAKLTQDVANLKTAHDASKDELAMADIRALDIGNSGKEARLVLEEKLRKMEFELTCANNEAEDARTDCENAKARVEVLEGSVSDVKAEAEKAVDLLNNDLEAANTSLSSLSALNKNLQKQLDKNMADMTAEIENVTNANCKLEFDVKEKENTIMNLKDEMKELQKRFDLMRNELSCSAEEMVVKLKEMENERDLVSTNILELERSAENAVKEAQENASSIIAELSTCKEDLQTELESLRKENDECLEAKNMLSKQIEAMGTNLVSKEQLVEFLTNEKEEISQKVESLSQENVYMTNALKASDKLVAASNESSTRAVDLITEAHMKKQAYLEELLEKAQLMENKSRASLASICVRLRNVRVSCRRGQADSTIPEIDSEAVAEQLQVDANCLIVAIEQHIHSNQILAGELQEVQEQCKKLTDSNEVMRQENNVLRTTSNKYKAVIVENEGKLQALVDRQQKVDSLLQWHKEVADMAEARLAEQEDAAETSLIAAQGHLQSLEEENKKLKSGFASSIEEATAELAVAVSEKESAADELAKLHSLHKTQCMLVEEYTAKIRNLQADNQEISDELASSNQTLAMDRKALQELSEQKISLESLLEESRKSFESKAAEEVANLDSISRLTESVEEKQGALERAEFEVKRLGGVLEQLRAEIERVASSQKTEYDAKMAELCNTHESQVNSLKEGFKKQFNDASEQSAKALEALRSEKESLDSTITTLEKGLESAKDCLKEEQSSSEKTIHDLQRKLKGALQAHNVISQRKAEIEANLVSTKENLESVLAHREELTDEVKEKVQSEKLLQKRLYSAEAAMKSLESKVIRLDKAAEEAVLKNRQEMESLLSRLEGTQDELRHSERSKAEAVNTSARCQSEIERLHATIIPTLRDDVKVAKKEVAVLELEMSKKCEEFSKLKDASSTQNEALSRKLKDVDGKLLRREEALGSKDAIVSKLRGDVKRMQEDLESQQSLILQLRAECESEKNMIVDKEEQVRLFKDNISKVSSSLEASQNNLEEKSCALEKAEKLVQDISAKYKEKSCALEKAEKLVQDISAKYKELADEQDGQASKEVYLDMCTETKRMHKKTEKLEKKTKKLERQLKRTEKQLVIAKKKGIKSGEPHPSLTRGVEPKRQLSPSVKGISPAVKRLREQHRREPLSPITNSRPPRGAGSTLSQVSLRFG